MGASADLRLLAGASRALKSELRRAWAAGLAETAKVLLVSAGRPSRLPVDSLRRAAFLAVLRGSLAELAAGLVLPTVRAARALQAASLDGFDVNVGAARRASLLSEGARNVRTLATTSLARFSGRVVPDLAARAASALWRELSASVLAAETVRAGESEAWQLDRIAVSVLAFAFNRIRTELAAGQDVLLRWTERVDDATGRPRDDRVGADSLALHGQIAPVGGTFVMPSDPSVWRGWWGRRWSHPPNRPNCRAVLVVWRPSLGLPAWRWSGGQRVHLTVRPDASA